MALETNVLYYGDNLHILQNRDYFPDECVDLIYLDPPFNSNRSYNVLFRESTGAGSEAQLEAFEDTWHWGPGTQATYEEVLTGPHQDVGRMLQAMVDALGHNDVTAYLTMMAVRLVELRRVLKESGSIYLHCDQAASHYLKLILDGVFGADSFRNELVWKRTTAHSDSRKHFSRVTDSILFYSKSDSSELNQGYVPHQESYIRSHYRHVDDRGRRYRLDNIIRSRSMGERPNLAYEYKGFTPPYGWRVLREKLVAIDQDRRMYWSKNGKPYLIRYLDEQKGEILDNLWYDIPPVNSQAQERLGYPTQKPLALLERIINASSNPGDVVLDPFCGCGTAVHAAQKLERLWIGIDVTHLAIGLIRRRMRDAFPGIKIKVIGEPVDLTGAQELAARDKYQFQWWALDQIGAQPVSGKKKGADKGIDGVLPFFESPQTDFRRALISVKGGEHVGVGMIRDLRGVIEREEEPIGILLTLTPPTGPMVTEAAKAGSYENEFWQKRYARIQILTVEEILAGKRPDTPQQRSPFAEAPRERKKAKTERML